MDVVGPTKGAIFALNQENIPKIPPFFIFSDFDPSGQESEKASHTRRKRQGTAATSTVTADHQAVALSVPVRGPASSSPHERYA